MSDYAYLQSRTILRQSTRLLDRIDVPALAAFVAPLLLYWATLAPTIYNLDSAELTTAVATDGIIRATGYPLYLLLGKVWSWLPIGDVGFRLNLFSAVCGAATIFLGDRILRRLQVSSWPRLAALGLLAAAPYFWAMSLIAEVYTLHTALMAAVIWLLLRWAEQPTALRLFLPVLVMMLSFGNHAATILLVPACVWYVVTQHPQALRRPQTWLAGLAGLAAGSLIFLVLPWRYGQMPVFNYAGIYDAAGAFHPVNLQTWSGFWWLISGQSFSGQMFGYTWPQVGPEVVHYGQQLWRAFFAVGIGPGLLGLVVLWRRDWRWAGALTLMFMANAVFYINYRVVDKNTMFLPTYLVWAIWAGIGFQVLWQAWVSVQMPRRWHWAGRGFMVGLVLLAVIGNWSLVDRSQDWSTREQSEEIMHRLEPNAIVFGWWETVPGLQYLQLVEGERPDVLLINRFLIHGDDMNQLILRELGRRPIYIDNPSVLLLQQAKVKPVGSIYLLEPRDAVAGP